MTYNSATDLDTCLSGVQRQNVAGGHELVVVDNASADDSAERVKAWADDVRDQLDVQIVCNPTNVGYAAANNQAAEMARGRVLVMLNPDAAMDDGCLQALVDHLTANPGVGVASALLRNPDGTVQEFARRELTLGSVFWDLTEPGRRIDHRWRDERGRRTRRYADEFAGLTGPLPVDCPAAACTATWRELTTPRLFDESLPLFFNDAELFARIRSRHYRCEVVPAAGCVHGYGTSHRRVNTARKRAEFVAAMRIYAARRFGLWWTAALDALLLVDIVCCLVLSARQRNRRLLSVARGTLGGLWLPGGAEPWLTVRMPLRRRLTRLRSRLRAQRRDARAHRARRRRCKAVVRMIRREARALNAPVSIAIAPTADVARDIRIELRAGQRSHVEIGDGVIVSSGVLLRLWGGTLRLGAGTQVRHDATLIVKGLLETEPRVIVSRGAQLHADGTMRIGFGAAVAERATLVDSEHTFDDVPTVIFDKPVRQADITVEPQAFVGTSAVVRSGVTIGRAAVVAALSVVTRDVPAYTIVAGAPAVPIRDVDRVIPP